MMTSSEGSFFSLAPAPNPKSTTVRIDRYWHEHSPFLR